VRKGTLPINPLVELDGRDRAAQLDVDLARGLDQLVGRPERRAGAVFVERGLGA
jgi:hypothetical protein